MPSPPTSKATTSAAVSVALSDTATGTAAIPSPPQPSHPYTPTKLSPTKEVRNPNTENSSANLAGNPANTTTGTTTTNQTPKVSKVRRSLQRRLAQADPIVAPGFGTQKDLVRLTIALAESTGSGSGSLPVETVAAIMRSRGRGLRSSEGEGSGDAGPKDPPSSSLASAPPVNAWADFMTEEGVSGGAAKSTTSASGTAAMATEKSSTAVAAAASGTMSSTKRSKSHSTGGAGRDYDLPLVGIQWSTYDQGVVAPADDNDADAPAAKKKARIKSTSAAGSAAVLPDETAGGVLVQTGTLDSTVVGRVKIKVLEGYHLPVPTRLLAPTVKIRSVFTGCNAAHSIAVDTAGQAWGWGRNEAGQLFPAAASAGKAVGLPTRMDGLPSGMVVRQAATGKSHTLFLMQDPNSGKTQVWSIGLNKAGQCGVKSSVDTVANYRQSVFEDENATIVQISCGEDFSMALSSQGRLYSSGSSEFGQLGNGETGEYILTAGKVAFANSSFFALRNTFCHAPTEKLHGNSDKSTKVVPLSEDVRIGHVSCGKHHVIAVEATASEEKARVFSWGCGDYGCLGHGVQQDEYFPRVIGSLQQNVSMGATQLKVSAGAHCSLVQTMNGHVYYWGKHRSMGEAMMRPSLVDVLANNRHVVTHCAAGGQTVLCSTAGAQTVAWGQGPHGELGLAKAKSSAKPTFIPTLDKCVVADMACGYGHTLFIIKDDDKEDKEANTKLEALAEADIEALEEATKATG